MWQPLQIARKDIRQRLRDRSAYVMGIIAPLGLAFLVGSIIPGLVEGETMWKVAVADQDGGPVAEGFVAVLDAVEQQGHIEIEAAEANAIDGLIRDEDYAFAFVIPAGFSDDVLSAEPTEVTVVGSANYRVATEYAEALATEFTRQVGAAQVSVGAVVVASEPEPTQAELDALIERAAALTTPITLERFETAQGGFDFKSYFAAGMAVFFLFFVVQFGALSLLGEREQGTLARLLVAPMRPSAVLLGKYLGSVLLGVASLGVMVVGSTLLIQADWGDPLGVAVLGLAGVLAAVGVVTLIATYARTEEQARGLADLAAIVLGLLGGAFFPVGLSSADAMQITWISPHRWLLEGFRDLNGGSTLVDILPIVGVVLLFALVLGGLGLLRARKLRLT